MGNGLSLVHKKTKKQVKFYSYYKYIEKDTDKQRNYILNIFKSKKEKKECDIVCSCNNKTKMLIYEVSGGNLKIRSNKGEKENHNKKCAFYGTIERNYTDKGIKEIDDGFILTVDEDTFNIDTNSSSSQNIKADNISYKIGRDYSNKSNFREFVKNYNLICWEKFYKNNGRNPVSINEFFAYSYGLSNNVYINKKNKSLNSLYYSYKATSNKMFLYMVLASNPIKTKVGYKLELLNITKDSNVKFSAFITDKVLNNAKNEANIDKFDCDFLVGGVITKNKKYYVFENIAFLRLSSRGLVADDLNTIELFDKLHSQNRTFIKPYKEVVGYYDIPSFIIKDTNKDIICEIINTYDEKFNIPENDSLEFDFWHWDTSIDKTAPALPKKEA